MLEAFQLSTPQDEKLRGTRLSENPEKVWIKQHHKNWLLDTGAPSRAPSNGLSLAQAELWKLWHCSFAEDSRSKNDFQQNLQRHCKSSTSQTCMAEVSLVTHWNQNHGTFASSRFLLLTLMTLPLFLSFISRLLPYAPIKTLLKKSCSSLTLFFMDIHPKNAPRCFICESYFLMMSVLRPDAKTLQGLTSGKDLWLSTIPINGGGEDFNFQNRMMWKKHTSKSAEGPDCRRAQSNLKSTWHQSLQQKLQWSTVRSTISVSHLAILLDYHEISCCLDGHADSSDIVHFQVTRNIWREFIPRVPAFR